MRRIPETTYIADLANKAMQNLDSFIKTRHQGTDEYHGRVRLLLEELDKYDAADFSVGCREG